MKWPRLVGWFLEILVDFRKLNLIPSVFVSLFAVLYIGNDCVFFSYPSSPHAMTGAPLMLLGFSNLNV